MSERSKPEIKGLSIPDADMPGWIQSLVEGGFSTGEIDAILSHLNQAYFEAKGQGLVEELGE